MQQVGTHRYTKLTDTCLFSIAQNCPNLELIYLGYDDVDITSLGLIELLKKCSKLRDIESGNEDLPSVIQDQLKKVC